jgi:hypothetical protein
MIRALRSRLIVSRILFKQLPLKRFLSLMVYTYGLELGLRVFFRRMKN